MSKSKKIKYYVYAGYYENYITGHKLPPPYILREVFDSFNNAQDYVMANYGDDTVLYTEDVAENIPPHCISGEYIMENDLSKRCTKYEDQYLV